MKVVDINSADKPLMTLKQRDWARQHSWFYCSDSKAIWAKDSKGMTIKFTSIKTLKHWAQGESK